jgi:hypothetical protein
LFRGWLGVFSAMAVFRPASIILAINYDFDRSGIPSFCLEV